MKYPSPNEVLNEINHVLICLNTSDESKRKEAEQKIEILEKLEGEFTTAEKRLDGVHYCTFLEYYVVLVNNILNSENCLDLRLVIDSRGEIARPKQWIHFNRALNTIRYQY